MLSLLTPSTAAAPTSDLITNLPGFGNSTWPFKAYSGYLTVPGPFQLTDYDSLEIHYQLHMSQNNPSSDPLVTWHQGGPGGSSIDVGLYTEMGFFQIDDQGFHTNDYAWNKVANMLYLESPAGSGQSSGFSACIKGGKDVACHWDDVSQGEAYAHALAAFRNAFPELSASPLYLTGESYFGQYGPNIANWILTHAPFNTSLKLAGAALGNACWGGDATNVNCNGPNEEQNDLDMFFGKGLISKVLYEKAYKACPFPATGPLGLKCHAVLEEVSEAVGPHNVYNIYDDCALGRDALETVGGGSMRQLRKALRAALVPGAAVVSASGAATPTGGYTWSCGGMDATSSWIVRDDVKAALHLKAADRSAFHYSTSGPASITLYPFLATKMRLLIYNGDADACVPYKGNEEWIDGLVTQGVLAAKDEWRPWYTTTKADKKPPAGYVTTYTVAGAPSVDFSFVTIRLAGHMVPTFQPAASLAFFTRFLAAEPM